MKWPLVVMLALATPVAAQETNSTQQAAEDALQKFPETAPPHEVLVHPHREQRDKFLWGTFGPPGILDAMLGAGIGQVLNTPDEWGRSKTALAKRFSTEYAESAINGSTKYLVARIRDEDPSFHPCGCRGFHRRALHAIISPVIAYRFDDGQPQFSVARMAGTAVAGTVSGNTWKPGGQNAGTEIAHVGFDLLSAAGVDLLREFIFHRRSD